MLYRLKDHPFNRAVSRLNVHFTVRSFLRTLERFGMHDAYKHSVGDELNFINSMIDKQENQC